MKCPKCGKEIYQESKSAKTRMKYFRADVIRHFWEQPHNLGIIAATAAADEALLERDAAQVGVK